MRKLCIPAIAAAFLFAAPAFATPPDAGTSAKTAPESSQAQQDLHQDLTKAGYTDIRIVPGSFLVRAKNKQGNETEMMIGPNSMTEVTAMKSSDASTPAGKSATSTSDGTSLGSPTKK